MQALQADRFPLPTSAAKAEGWGIGASLALHALLALAVLVSPIGPALIRPLVPSISVELVPLPAVQPPTAEATMPELLAAPPETGGDAATPAQPAVPDAAPAGYIRSTARLSAAALADPRSAKAREALAGLAGAERIAQLCNLEAKEQIAAWNAAYRPDFIVSFARSTEVLTDSTLRAGGAAVHSGSAWYDLRYNCQLSQSHDEVVAFEFQMGSTISLREQEELGLPGEIEEDDDDD